MVTLLTLSICKLFIIKMGNLVLSQEFLFHHIISGETLTINKNKDIMCISHFYDIEKNIVLNEFWNYFVGKSLLARN